MVQSPARLPARLASSNWTLPQHSELVARLIYPDGSSGPEAPPRARWPSTRLRETAPRPAAWAHRIEFNATAALR